MSASVKASLHGKLRDSRAALLTALDGLGEYDRRRPLTPSGTNLLGLVKHLTGIELVYLGEAVGRPSPIVLPWIADGSIWDGADMWATAAESSEDLMTGYRLACAHGDRSLAELDLDAPAQVPHWPADRRRTTLGVLLVRMVDETARHAGHADIIRELIDGRGGADHDQLDETGWQRQLARIQAAADAHRQS